MKKKYIVILFVLGFFNIVLQAQHQSININRENTINHLPLNDEEKNSPEFQGSLIVRQIDLNSLLYSENIAVGDTIVLDLFINKTYKAIIDKIQIDVNGTKSIRARIIDFQSGICLINLYQSTFFFNINIPELQELYSIKKQNGTASYFLIQSDINQLDILEGDPSLKIPLKLNTESLAKSPKKILASPIAKASGIDDPANIDIMILYTPAATLWSSTYSGGINNTIANVMASSQLALDNSETSITLNLVHSEEINYVESGSSYTDLMRLTFSEAYDPYQMENGAPWYMDEVHTLRDQYKADMVILLTKTSDTGGLSFLLENPDGEPNYPFAIVRVQQATSSPTTAIHEFGHTSGCHHHKLQTTQPGPGLFSYSAGWRWQGSDTNYYADLMTYASSYFLDGISHTKVPYFSNPLVNYMGVATGNAVDGDNARTLKEEKHIMAAYRQAAGQDCNVNTYIDYVSRGNISGGGVYLSGQTAILNATANTGYVFRDWVEGGAVVSTSPTYSFTVTGDRNFTASFRKEVEGCSGGTQNPASSLTPTSSWQTQTGISLGDFCLFDVISGETYTWSFCRNDGAEVYYDTQLSLINNANQNLLAYNDNYCGIFSRITWTANFTGQVRVLATAYDCENMSTNATLAYKKEAATNEPKIVSNITKEIQLYPIPTKDKLTIDVTSSFVNHPFEILNFSGQSIYKGILKEKTEVAMGNYTEGTYFLKATNGERTEIIQFMKK